MNILDKIVVRKREELIFRKNNKTLESLKKSHFYKRSTVSLEEKLRSKKEVGIIAEFKRQSPSKGIINKSDSKVEDVVKGYKNAGVSAISVLTDIDFFGAREEDILIARENCDLPILRKEFIIDTYQVHEAKAMGADLVLLIGAILTKATSQLLSNVATDLGLEVLYEIHDESEIELIPDNVNIVGINNRDLKHFIVDFERSMRMFNMLPEHHIKIAESGISNPITVADLTRKGFDGFLIGETFMKEANPGEACHDFINLIKNIN